IGHRKSLTYQFAWPLPVWQHAVRVRGFAVGQGPGELVSEGFPVPDQDATGDRRQQINGEQERGHGGENRSASAEDRRMVVQLHPVAARVADLLGPHIERQGFELVSVEYHKGTRSSMLRLLVDRPDGGI